MKVSSHPAQVVIPNKDKERGLAFKFHFRKSSEKPKNNLRLTQVLSANQPTFH